MALIPSHIYFISNCIISSWIKSVGFRSLLPSHVLMVDKPSKRTSCVKWCPSTNTYKVFLCSSYPMLPWHSSGSNSKMCAIEVLFNVLQWEGFSTITQHMYLNLMERHLFFAHSQKVFFSQKLMVLTIEDEASTI